MKTVVEKIMKCIINSIGDDAKNISSYPVLRYSIVQFLLENFFKHYEDIDAFFYGNFLYEHQRLSKAQFIILAQSKDWAIEDLIEIVENVFFEICIDQQRLKDELKKAFCIQRFSNKVFSNKIKSSLCDYFFGTQKLSSLFEEFPFRNCHHYVAWTEKEEEFTDCLNEHSVVFVSGPPAIGKYQFVSHYFIQKKKEPHFVDVCMINADNSSLLSKASVEFSYFLSKKHVESTLEKSLRYFRHKHPSFYIIIYRPILDSTDFDFIKNKLSNLSCKVIIITRTPKELPNSIIFWINKWPTELLKKLFNNIFLTEKNTSKNILSEDELNILFKQTEYNPYWITIIAKSLKEYMPEYFKDTLHNPYFRTWKLSGRINYVKSGYRDNNSNTAFSLSNLICRVLAPYNDKLLNDTLKRLCIWASSPVSEKFLTTHAHISNSEFNQAVTYGFLIYVDERHSLVKMPNILAEAIRLKLYDPNYYEIVDDIISQIQSGQNVVSNYSSIYSSIESIISFYHEGNITFRHKKIKSQKTRYYEWNDVLKQFFEIYYQLGAYSILPSIQENIYKSYDSKNKNMTPKQTQRDIQYATFLDALTDYRSHQDLYKLIDDLKAILQDVRISVKHNKQKYQSDSQKYRSLALYLIDISIDIEKNIMIEQFFEEPYNYSSNAKIDNLTLLHLINISNDNDLHFYYLMIKEYLLAIYHDQTRHLTARQHYWYLKANVVNPELLIKTELHMLFYELIINKLSMRFHNQPYSLTTINWFAKKIRDLKHEIFGKIWSSDIVESYHRLFLLFILVYPTIPLTNWGKQELVEYVTQLKTTFTDQIHIRPDESQTLDDSIKELQTKLIT